MVMCEYMACGRTVIASDATGHADVLTAQNAFLLNCYSPVVVSDGKDQPIAVWHEANVEEILEQLEYAYQNREICRNKSEVAAENMRKLSWEKAAWQFHDIADKLNFANS